MVIQVAICQLKVGSNKGENLKKAGEMIEKAAYRGAQLVVLPEMFNCPYDGSYFPSFAEDIPNGRTYTFLQEMAIKQKIILCGGSIPEKGEDGIYNTALLFQEDGALLLKHRKIHLFHIDIPGGITFRESDTLKAGKDLQVAETSLLPLGLLICYDVRFPEAVRILALKGAQLLIIPGAFNLTTGPPHWSLLLRSRALDNQIFMVGASPARDGKAPYVAYGHSIITDPWGEVVAEGGEGEEILEASIDTKRIQEIRRGLPLLQNRREDLYGFFFDH